MCLCGQSHKLSLPTAVFPGKTVRARGEVVSYVPGLRRRRSQSLGNKAVFLPYLEELVRWLAFLTV